MDKNRGQWIFWSLAGGLLFSIALVTKGAPGWIVFLVGVVGFLGMIFVLPPRRRTDVFVGAAVFCIAASFGIWRGQASMSWLESPSFAPAFGEEIELVGQVVREPDVRFTNVKITVTPTSITSGEWSFFSGENILVTLPLGSLVDYGDDVWFRGRLDEPENFVGDTGREFDYVGYLAKDHVRGLLYQPEFEVIESSGGNPVKRFLYRVKSSLVGTLSRVVPAPAAWLGGGIVYGEKQALNPNLQDIFRRVGLMHLVVLSGYNVTIVAEALRRMTLRFGIRASALFGIVGVILFAIMVGGGATIIRASVMATLVIVAKAIGRPASATRLLVVAGTLMLVINPLTLWYDISFQLSFLATLGLIYLAPWVEKKLSWLPNKLQLREHAAATVSAQIAVLPILITAMGEVSVIAPIVNMLVLPLIPLAMAGVALVSVLGLVWLPLAQVVAIPTTALLVYVIKISEWFSALPFSVWRF